MRADDRSVDTGGVLNKYSMEKQRVLFISIKKNANRSIG